MYLYRERFGTCMGYFVLVLVLSIEDCVRTVTVRCAVSSVR